MPVLQNSCKTRLQGGRVSRQEKYYLEARKPSGIYYYVVRDPVSRKTTAFKSTGTTDEKQAKAIALEWWVNGVPGKRFSGVDRVISFCDYLTNFWDFASSEYFRELETMGNEPQPEHALEMQKIVKRYYAPYFKEKLLCQIDGNEMQKFILHLKHEKKLASSTINLTRNTALKALRYALRKKIILKFDFENVLRAGGKPKQRRGVLTNHEVEKLFKQEWTCVRSRIAILIAYHTGMRLGEIRALRVCDIHENRISVQYSWSSKKNRRKSTKNGEIGDIPILPSLYNEILVYIRQKKILKLDALLLPGKKPEKPFDSVQIRKNFHEMLEKIGIDNETRKNRGIVIHSFRHLMAKNLVENGVDISIGKKILRQKTDSVFNHYADHVDKETFDFMATALETVRQQNNQSKVPILFRGGCIEDAVVIYNESRYGRKKINEIGS